MDLEKGRTAVNISRRRFVQGVVGGAALLPLSRARAGEGGEEKVVRYVRFRRGDRVRYGRLEGDRIRVIRGRPWASPALTDRTVPLAEVTLLCPCEPSKVLAMAGNYRSHLEDAPVPENPEVFIKAPSALLAPGGTIVIPEGTDDVHYEAELVLVIGKQAKNISPEEAPSHVLGVTCGNDVSARDWQANDTQWWRAKACDTFAPTGPAIVCGLDPGDLRIRSRLNGEVKQDARTSELIFGVPAIVSFISRHMTLLPGDLIFTGTPGTTSAMKPGDRVEVEIERVGALENRVG